MKFTTSCTLKKKIENKNKNYINITQIRHKISEFFIVKQSMVAITMYLIHLHPYLSPGGYNIHLEIH